MIDHFALLGEARRPWLDAEKLKEKYFAQSRVAPPNAELNEAFRVLADPKLRLPHLLKLEGAELVAGRPVPAQVAELFWQTGKVLREAESWLQKNAATTGNLARAMLHPERARLEEKLAKLETDLSATYAAEMERLRQLDANWERSAPNDLAALLETADAISYLTKLLERTKEQRLQFASL